MRYRLWYLALLRQWINRSQRAGVVVAWEWIMVAGFCVDLRNDFRGEEVAQWILTFVCLLVFALRDCISS